MTDTPNPGYAAAVTIDQIVISMNKEVYTLDYAEEPDLFEKCESMIKRQVPASALKEFLNGA